MKQYNRALDRVLLAMNEMRQGNHVLAAKMFASATKELDFERGMAIIEASNKHAAAVEAKAREEAAKLEAAAKAPVKSAKVQASDEFVEDLDVEQDPLDEIEDEEDDGDDVGNPTEEMASVLARMVRKAK